MRVIPGFPNRFPWNELLFRGLLSAKTRTWKWSHCGWTVLYTSSSRVESVAVADYVLELLDCNPKATLGKLVGIGYLKPVRKNTSEEMETLESEFGNGVHKGPWDLTIVPGLYRYEFEPLYRFSKPIPFKPPRGAVTTFSVPVALLATELRKFGIVL